MFFIDEALRIDRSRVSSCSSSSLHYVKNMIDVEYRMQNKCKWMRDEDRKAEVHCSIVVTKGAKYQISDTI